MKPLPSRVAARWLQAAPRHYKVDKSDRRLRRDAESEMDSARYFGWYEYPVLRILHLSEIQPEKVWREAKLEAVLKDIDARRPLKPILVSKQGSKYAISDGIHRYNASKERGFTHIPAIEYITVQTPELYRPPEPEKPKLRPGTFVKVRDPKKWLLGSPWAIVNAPLSSTREREIRRHKYELFGYPDRQDSAGFIGDFLDNTFEVASPPRAIQDELKQASF